MKTTLILATFGLLILGVPLLPAQSPAFSQFFALPNTLNPAYVSAIRGAEASAGYRLQWGQVQEGFHTKAATVAVRSCGAPVAFGAYVNHVSEPFFGYRQQEGGLQVSAFVPASSEKFSIHGGFQAGFGQHRVDYARLLFAGQLDPLFGIQGGPSPFFLHDGSKVQTFETGFGLVARGQIKWRNSDLPASIGFAVRHFGGSRDVSFLRLESKQSRLYLLHGSITTPVTGGLLRKDVLYLNWLARFEWESALRRSTTGVIFQYEAANLGLLYQWNRSPFATRNTHALTLSIGVGFKMGDKTNCVLQYAFDGTLSGLKQTSTGGAHELIAVFTFPQSCIFKNGDKSSRKGKTDCYHFIGKGYRPFMN